jgi:hypothetical protein
MTGLILVHLTQSGGDIEELSSGWVALQENICIAIRDDAWSFIHLHALHLFNLALSHLHGIVCRKRRPLIRLSTRQFSVMGHPFDRCGTLSAAEIRFPSHKSILPRIFSTIGLSQTRVPKEGAQE